ncbi:lead, cadmium, zinc and mercury transporting ATPase [Pseudonocardia sp. N23]|nr:lead, cadmium, zinc and mercury transporting ATPase [Pseudonocardia sp. N23]
MRQEDAPPPDTKKRLVIIPQFGVADGVVVIAYVAALLVPGGLVGFVGGLRGWTLVASAPLFTYAVSGIAGPLHSAMGIRWSPVSWAVAFVVVVVVVGGLRLVVRRRRGAPEPGPTMPPWSLAAQLAVVAATVVATLVGIVVILGGIRTLGAIPQDWDAVFHANGIRYIATTGDGSLYGMGLINWYEPGAPPIFYPNAYHLLGTVVYELTGATVPTVLNAHTVLIPGLIGLSLVALVRRYGGRPIVAAGAALAVVAVSSVYDLLWRGPLLPFATGVALTPVLVVLVVDMLDAQALRSTLRPALLFALGMAGLLCLHPAILIGAVLFTLPALVQRWWTAPARAPREIGLLVVAGVLAAIACTAQLAGTLSSAGNLAAISWPADLSTSTAVGQVLTFGHGSDTIQLWLTAFLLVGVLTYRRLGSLRWVGFTAAIFAALFVVAAASSAPWAKTITSLWWNDRWRLIALTAVPLCIVVGHGLGELQRLLVTALSRIADAARHRPPEALPSQSPTTQRVLAVATSVVVLLAFVVLTRGLYTARDQARMMQNSGNGPAVSGLEIVGMEEIARIVPPGERVLNDRGDGSTWLYALTGLQPVAGHYDGFRTGPDAGLLAQRFNQYPDDPAVRTAVQQLDIEYVQLDAGFLRSDAARAPGLTGLAGADWLTVVYRNPDVVLYRIDPPGTERTSAESRAGVPAGPLLSDGSG